MITKEDFGKLYNPDISKREYDRILDDVQRRVVGIWKEILRIENRKWYWFDFNNGYGEDGGGYFDPSSYQEEVRMKGDFDFLSYPSKYASGFPTEFLWTENSVWQKIVTDDYRTAEIEYERREAETKKRVEGFLAKRAEMHKIIASKLTKEELKYISFK